MYLKQADSYLKDGVAGIISGYKRTTSTSPKPLTNEDTYVTERL
jgi:hypothetical protein